MPIDKHQSNVTLETIARQLGRVEVHQLYTNKKLAGIEGQNSSMRKDISSIQQTCAARGTYCTQQFKRIRRGLGDVQKDAGDLQRVEGDRRVRVKTIAKIAGGAAVLCSVVAALLQIIL